MQPQNSARFHLWARQSDRKCLSVFGIILWLSLQNPDLNPVKNQWKIRVYVEITEHFLNKVTELESICNEERLTLHKYRCTKLFAAHPRWRQSVTADSGASGRQYWIWVWFHVWTFFVLLNFTKILVLLCIMGYFVNANGMENTTFITFELSLEQNKMWRKWKKCVRLLSEVSLGRLSLSARVREGPAPSSPETKRKLSWLSFVCMACLTMRTMPSAAAESEPARAAR